MRPAFIAVLFGSPLRASAVSGVAPFGVVFDAVATPGMDWRAGLFFFDFGDGGAGTYTYGSKPGADKNKHAGVPVCAHCYEAPGTYTARMWAYDGTTIRGPYQRTVTVTDPDAVYAGSNTICFSGVGDFTGAPSGSTNITTSNWNTIITVHANTGKRLLMRAGEVFTMSAAALLGNGRADIYFGAFGSGAKPEIRAGAAGQTLIGGTANSGNPLNNAKRWRVNGLKFTSGGFATVGGVKTGIIAPAVGAIPNNPDAADGYFTVSNCDFDGVYFPLFIDGRGNVAHKCTTNNLNNGVSAAGGTSVWTSDSYQTAVIDSLLDNNHGSEHVVRLQGWKYAVLQGVTAKRPPTNKHFVAFRGADPGAYVSEYGGLIGCLLDGTTTTSSSVQMSHFITTNVGGSDYIDKAFVEGCVYIANNLTQTIISIDANNVEIRDSVFYCPATATAMTDAIAITKSNTKGSPTPTGSRVVACSAYSAAVLASYAFVRLNASAINTTAIGNVVYAPSAAGTPTAVLNLSSPDTTTASNNSTNTQVKTISPLWSAPTAGTLAGYVLGVGSPYINSGSAIAGVYQDAQGYLRGAPGSIDMGAANSVAKTTGVWSLVP